MTSLISKAFNAGVQAALKLFQQPSITREVFAKSGETVLKNMEKVVRVAAKTKIK